MIKFYTFLVFVVIGITAVVCRQPVWYKPCWVFFCGMDPIDPVCTWDPEHGARLFKNECSMKRHNYCYDRNYAIVNKNLRLYDTLRLCKSLKNLTDPSPQNMHKYHHRLPKYY